jgi:hypothetical protein
MRLSKRFIIVDSGPPTGTPVGLGIWYADNSPNGSLYYSQNTASGLAWVKTTAGSNPAAITSLSEDTGTNGFGLFDFSWTNTDSNNGVYYKIDTAPTTDTDGTLVGGANVTSLSDIDFTSLGEGTHAIYVWTRNANGADFSTAQTVNATYDIQKPGSPVGLTRTSSSPTTDTDVDVSWTNPSDQPVTGAYYKVGSAPTSDTDGTLVNGSQLTSISDIDVSGQSYGTVTIYVWLNNSEGADYTTADSVSLTLNAPVPGAITNLLANPQTSTGDKTIDFTWTNPSGSVTHIKYKVSVGSPAPPTSTSNYTARISATTSTTITISPTASGQTIYYYFWAENAAGDDYTTYATETNVYNAATVSVGSQQWKNSAIGNSDNKEYTGENIGIYFSSYTNGGGYTSLTYYGNFTTAGTYYATGIEGTGSLEYSYEVYDEFGGVFTSWSHTVTLYNTSRP